MAIYAQATVETEDYLIQSAYAARESSSKIGVAILTSTNSVYSCSVENTPGKTHLIPYAMGCVLLKGERIFKMIVIASQDGARNDLCTCRDCMNHLLQYAQDAKIRIVNAQGLVTTRLALSRPVEQPLERISMPSSSFASTSGRFGMFGNGKGYFK